MFAFWRVFCVTFKLSEVLTVALTIVGLWKITCFLSYSLHQRLWWGHVNVIILYMELPWTYSMSIFLSRLNPCVDSQHLTALCITRKAAIRVAILNIQHNTTVVFNTAMLYLIIHFNISCFYQPGSSLFPVGRLTNFQFRGYFPALGWIHGHWLGLQLANLFFHLI